jgi:hypothetical protein
MLTRLGLLEAVTVPQLCDVAGQDVADAGAAGTAITSSRCDHVHEGVHSLVAGTNITLSPSSGLGDVTVTSSGGGGGVTEGDYSSYALQSTILDASDDGGVNYGSAFNTTETKIVVVDDGYNITVIDVAAGTESDSGVNTPGWYVATNGQSVFGKYVAAVVVNTYDKFYIFKDGVLLQTVDIEDTFDRFYGLVVSPTGQYILAGYKDASASAPNRYHWKLYKGS